MSVIASSTPLAPRLPRLPVRRFSVDEYHRLIRDGYFREDDPYELLEGWIVEKMPRDPIHDNVIELADQALRPRLPEGFRVRVQPAITTRDSEPEPDLAIVSGSPRDRADHHPGPAEIAWLIEVANTSLEQDRQDKARVYAGASIAVHWIINIVDAQVEVYTDPTGPGPEPRYRRRNDHALGEEVPMLIGGREVARVAVRELLP